jgi:dynein heavy chain
MNDSELLQGLKTRGNVEEWLGKVEDGMFNSLKRIMRNCLTDWHSMEREDWIQKFPSQCILTISQMMWAQIVHMILDGPGNSIAGMKEFETKNFEVAFSVTTTFPRRKVH